jgi:phosphoglycerate dehydrogenase-like enzyme
MSRPKGLFVLDESAYAMSYGPEERRGIAELVEIAAPAMTRDALGDRPALMREVDVLFSGWGAPVVDETFLDAAPNLRAIFYAGGSVASWITPEVWDRGIVVCSAYAANAVPVAEYALATTLFSLKHGWSLSRQASAARTFPERNGAPGCCGSTVGVISMGVSGRAFRRLLRPFELRVLAYDPYLRGAEAELLDVENVALEDVFRRSDVVSLHTPLLTETVGMIGGEHFAAMQPGATFINTARGGLVRESELIEVARRRPDLQFVLDVTDPEPPPLDSPLYALENVVLTPHIAGSVGRECRRMGRYMLEELKRYLSGQPLQWAITPEIAALSTHRPLRGRLRVALPAARRHRAAGESAASGV